MAQKVTKYFGLLLHENLSPRTYKNRPIWLHCSDIEKGVTNEKRRKIMLTERQNWFK